VLLNYTQEALINFV